jgi:hypothetical protein
MDIDHIKTNQINIDEDSFNNFNTLVQNEIDQQTNTQANYSEISTPAKLLPNDTTSNLNQNDIRNQNQINETEKIIYWSNALDLGCKTASQIIQFYLSLKADETGHLTKPLEAIFTKIAFKDRSFFRTFTNSEIIKPAHQKQYEKLIDEYHNNYKKIYNVSYINRNTKKKIKTIVNKAIAIAFIRHKTYNTRCFEIATLLDYLFNYFIDPNRKKIDFQDLLEECKTSIENNLPDLPANPNQIPTSLKIKLPTAIPLKNLRDITLLVNSLRAHYKFTCFHNHTFSKKTNSLNIPKIYTLNSIPSFPSQTEVNSTHSKNTSMTSEKCT